MSYCREEEHTRLNTWQEMIGVWSKGKDRIIFVTKQDYDIPSTSTIKLDDEDDEPGLILPSGEINWSCPCLGGMATGPCGVPFREAFSCFHYSATEVKGSECYEQFKTMQECMAKHPDLYLSDDVDVKPGEFDDLDDLNNIDEEHSDLNNELHDKESPEGEKRDLGVGEVTPDKNVSPSEMKTSSSSKNT